MREYKSLKALCSGEVIDLDGLMLKMAQGELRPGDLYIAERNTGPKLLTVQEVNLERRWVVPTTPDYSFDLHECVKVEEAD